MKVSELEKEVLKLNFRIDEIVSKLKRDEEKVCCEARPRQVDEIHHKTYEIVKRMKFDNDMKIIRDRCKDIDNEIKKLQEEKLCRMAEEIEIETERKYYQEF